MSSAAARPALPALTGLRFLAAAHVLVFHYGQVLLAGAPSPAVNLGATGYVGVALFFVLSGFVLAYVHPALATDGASLRAFWAARLARIYPDYLLGFLLYAPFAVARFWPGPSPAAAAGKLGAAGAATLSLTQAWTPWTSGLWNYPAWSLSVEAFFYLVFPFALARLRRTAHRRRWLLGLWLASLLPPLAYLWLEPAAGFAPPRGEWLAGLTFVKYWPPFRLAEFLTGILLGLAFLEERARGVRRGGGWLAGGAAAVLLLVLSAGDRVPFALLHNGLLVPAFAALVYGLARGGGWLGWLLSRPWLVLLGEASYALYILQAPLWEWTAPQASRLGLDPGGPAFAALYLALAVAVSVAVLRCFEVPARAWVRAALTRLGGRGADAGRPVG